MNRRALIATAAVTSLSALCPKAWAQGQTSGPGSTGVGVGAELERLRASLSAELGARFLNPDPRPWSDAAIKQVSGLNSASPIQGLVLVVDRNPKVQQLMVMLPAPDGGVWQSLGGCRISTGLPGAKDHFKTPLGAFENSSSILGFRALGTKNENGIRGYGIRGMRVWDFGWQDAERANSHINPGGMRLCMHATDPDRLERRLGTPASEGCVRLPAGMNRFLDHYGIIDRDDEEAAQTDRRFAALLRADREPTSLAGSYLVVVES